METVLILAAIVAVVISVVGVARTISRAARPHLRLPHEDAIEDDDHMMESFAPPQASPIDRSAPVLDLEPVEPPARRADRPDGAAR